jgi:hypothetical protein
MARERLVDCLRERDRRNGRPAEQPSEPDEYAGDHTLGGLPEQEPAPEHCTWQPFPLDALPDAVRCYASEAATALGADAAFVALPLLSALGAAIGNTRRVRLKREWTEPPILWALIVGESGTLKSPALDLALEFTRQRQREAFAAHKLAMKNWKYARDEEESEADRPVCERFIAGDVTLEALACRLVDSPRGLLLSRDELAGWFRSFDAYRKGRGGDLAHYLTLHRAGDLILDRKTGERETIIVPRAFLAVTGGVQPGVLRRLFTTELFETGLPARFLLAMPPRPRRCWTETEIHPDTRGRVERLFAAVWNLQPETDADGNPLPALVGLSKEGKAAWIDFFNQHADQHQERIGDLAAAWSKLEGYCARLALVFHCCRLADAGEVEAGAIDAECVENAARLVRWFAAEMERVYAALNESEGDMDRRELVELIRSRGGEITVRDLQRASRKYPTADAAHEALDALAKANLVRPAERPAPEGGGWPITVFRLTH